MGVLRLSIASYYYAGLVNDLEMLLASPSTRSSRQSVVEQGNTDGGKSDNPRIKCNHPMPASEASDRLG